MAASRRTAQPATRVRCFPHIAAILALALAPFPVAAQESGNAVETAPAASPVPNPTMGWILDQHTASIAPVFGSQPLETSGAGSAPAIALDGAGSIDGAALVGGIPSGAPVTSYALSSAAEPTLLSGTTVVLLCGRENNWLRSARGVQLLADAAGDWLVTKPGEWGLSLASATSPFAVVSAGEWVYAAAPPAPPKFVAFGPDDSFPPRLANSQVCVWALYDTSVKGSSSHPEISVAYDDGAQSTPVPLAAPVTAGTAPLELVFNQLGADVSTLFVWQGSAARLLFRQTVRADYWNNGLRRSIASGFLTPPWSGLAITALDPRPIALGGDAQDNVYAAQYAGFVRTSPFASYTVATSPNTPFLAVRYQLGNFPYQAYQYSISFELDGRYFGYDQPWRYGTNWRSIPLPQDGRSHRVTLRNGFTRSNGNYVQPTLGAFGGGGFIDAVAVPSGFKVSIVRPVPASVALVLSHSVAVGDLAGSVPYESEGPQSSIAWPVQAEAVRAFGTAAVMDESYGGELLGNNCLTAGACRNYLAAIHKAQPHITVGFVARMLNDFFHGDGSLSECLPQYQQALVNLFDAWSAEFPGKPLHVGSDVRESAELEEKTDGCTPALQLADWRSGIRNTVNNYASEKGATWLHFVDMSNWVPQNELLPGGIHPNVEGQIKICQAVATYFQQPVTCGVPK